MRLFQNPPVSYSAPGNFGAGQNRWSVSLAHTEVMLYCMWSCAITKQRTCQQLSGHKILAGPQCTPGWQLQQFVHSLKNLEQSFSTAPNPLRLHNPPCCTVVAIRIHLLSPLQWNCFNFCLQTGKLNKEFHMQLMRTAGVTCKGLPKAGSSTTPCWHHCLLCISLIQPPLILICNKKILQISLLKVHGCEVSGYPEGFQVAATLPGW